MFSLIEHLLRISKQTLNLREKQNYIQVKIYQNYCHLITINGPKYYFKNYLGWKVIALVLPDSSPATGIDIAEIKKAPEASG